MEPVTVRISKAKTVPATNSRHEYRTEWRHVYKITYNMSEEIFKNVGNPERGLKIETDAQFAKWLVDNFGHGRFHLHVFKKGISGWTFYNFDCTSSTRFCQVKKEKTFDERNKESMIREHRKKKRELEGAESRMERESIQEEIEDIESDLDVDDLVDDSNNKRKVKIRLFKNMQPVYKQHSYEEYSGNTEKEKGVDYRAW